jgi:hypothetical protein
MLAFDLAVPGRLAHVEPPELIYAYGTACAEFYRAAPWHSAVAGRVLGTLITGSVKRRAEVRILGPAGEQKGIVLFDPGANAELRRNADPNRIVDTMLRIESMGVAFSDNPGYAVDAMRRAYGLNSFPMAVKLVAGRNEELTSQDLLALSITLRAVSALRDPAAESSAELGVGEVRVAAIAWCEEPQR